MTPVYATQALDYAVLRFQVNGHNITGRLDGYAPGVQPAPAFVLAMFEPRAGKFRLHFGVAGANPASTGVKYFRGLDCVVVEKP